MRRSNSSTSQPKKRRTEKPTDGSTKPLTTTPKASKRSSSNPVVENDGVMTEPSSTPPLPPDPIVLKNGDTVSVREALNAYQFIKSAWEHHRGEFDAMVAALRCEQPADRDAETELREVNVIQRDGTLEPVHLSVMESLLISGVGGDDFPVPHLDDSTNREIWELGIASYRRRFDGSISKLIDGYGSSTTRS